MTTQPARAKSYVNVPPRAADYLIAHPDERVEVSATTLGVSTQTIRLYRSALIKDGKLTKQKRGKRPGIEHDGKITVEQRRALVRRFHRGEGTLTELAACYGISVQYAWTIAQRYQPEEAQC